MGEFKNPFTPGAGHQPPYLAGRETERAEFMNLLKQDTVLENAIITGLRGVGKTVLFDTLAPLAARECWYWVGTDLSEAASLSEENLITRIFTDLATITSDIVVGQIPTPPIGFIKSGDMEDVRLSSQNIRLFYDSIPGLASDKLKETLKFVWISLAKQDDTRRGIIFAYDEAQNLSDNAQKERYPLSMLLDVFQSLQRAGLPFMLALTGLPTLFPKLVDARTYAERMFHIILLESLDKNETRDAILKPIESQDCPVKLDERSVNTIYEMSGGYPYFIQFICRETYNALIQRHKDNHRLSVPVEEIQNKLDRDFFAGRWQRATDRQRDLMMVAATIGEREFSAQQIIEASHNPDLLDKPFRGGSQVNQILAALIAQGIAYKNRHGRYRFAIPLLDKFILRQVGMTDE